MELTTKSTFEHTYVELMNDIGTRVVEKGEERAHEAGGSGVDTVWEKKEGEKKRERIRAIRVLRSVALF